MLRTASKVVGALALVLILARNAPAQFNWVTAGSTVQGDIARGEGVFLYGAGMYNYYSAAATSINTDTWMRLNEYLYQSAKQTNLENARHRQQLLARKRENYNEILERIKNNPEHYDLTRGDALNSLFEQLSNPQIPETNYRLSPVHLPGDTVRNIPFFFGREDATFSMQRITTRGKWPVGLRDDRFARERRAYERAVDEALDQQLDGKLTPEAIRVVEGAVNDLFARLDRVIPPSTDKVYIEAKNHLRNLEIAKELLKRREIERILGEIDKYAGTTVHDLIKFMQRNNLRFGVPNLGDERALYPQLYAALRQQLDVVGVPETGTKK